MTTPRQRTIAAIRRRRSLLCVGLDPDLDRIPLTWGTGPERVLPFLQAVIEVTAPFAAAYKANTAFFERWGSEGWQWLEALAAMVPPSHLLLADAKRGDVGHTARQYAAAFCGGAWDGITVNPLMGVETLRPYLDHPDVWTIVLGLTSNPGAADFLQAKLTDGKPLYLYMMEKTAAAASPDHLMFVVGATRVEDFRIIRKALPEHFLLVPGVGAQGGDAAEVIRHLGLQHSGGLLINASRSILYPERRKGETHHAAIERAARALYDTIRPHLDRLLE